MIKGEEKPAVNTVKKVFSIIGTVLTVLIFALALVIIINMIVCRVQKRPVSFFGTSFAIVQTPSMEPEIMTGDLIVFHSCDYADIKEGDYLVFIADENFSGIQGQSIVHRVEEITPDGIVTKGINNANADNGFREKDEIMGICTYNSTAWGKIFAFLGKYGILIIIALVAVPFIIGQAIKIVKLSKQKETDGVVSGDGNSQNNALSESSENTPIANKDDKEE